MIARILATPASESRQPRRLHHRRGAVDPRRARDARDRSSRSTSSIPRPRSRCMTSGCRPRRWRAPRSSSRVYQVSRDPQAAADARQLRVPHRQRQRRGRFHCRDRAHRPQRRAEGTARRPVRRARRAARGSRLLCGPHHRLARAARPGRAGRKLLLSRRRAALFAARRAVPARRGTRAGAGHPRGDGRARHAVRHGLFRPARRSTSLDAAPQVLAALPGMDPGRLNAVLCATRSRRPQNAPARCWRCSAPRRRSPTTQGSKALRVTARIAFDSGQRVTTEAVIFILDSGTEPYRVLTWRDDIDDAPAERSRTALR